MNQHDSPQGGAQGAGAERDAAWSEPDRGRTERGNQLVLPLLLIAVGLLVLAGNFGLVSWNALWRLLDLWPVLLIAIGVDLLTRGRFRLIVVGATIVVVLAALFWGGAPFGGPAATVHEVAIPIENATRAEVDIQSSVARLEIESLRPGDLLVSGTVRAGENETFMQNARMRGATAVVALSSQQRGFGGVTNGADRRWELSLAEEIPLALNVSTGVGQSDLDLRDLTITDLRVSSGVGETTVALPSVGTYEAEFDTGVGRLVIRIPEEAEARVTVDRGLGSVTARGFESVGDDTYETSGYATARDRIDVSIDGGVGAIVIERVR